MRRAICLLLACAPVLFISAVTGLAGDTSQLAADAVHAMRLPLLAETPPDSPADPVTAQASMTVQTAELASLRGLVFPWKVGVQVGHWRIAELPDELARLRRNTGARFGSLEEYQVNLGIARRLVRVLRDAGIEADLLPATVPPGYDADAFVAIHADGAWRAASRGWKVAAPWRASADARRLRDSLQRFYPLFTGLPEDRYGVTWQMRGYYAFSWQRYDHAVSPSTPSVIIETGFVDSTADRNVLEGDPESAARGIAAGILNYLGSMPALRPVDLFPRFYPPQQVGNGDAVVRFYPGETEPVVGRIPAGTPVRPLDRRDGWVELLVWGDFRVSGWVEESRLEPIEALTSSTQAWSRLYVVRGGTPRGVTGHQGPASSRAAGAPG